MLFVITVITRIENKAKENFNSIKAVLNIALSNIGDQMSTQGEQNQCQYCVVLISVDIGKPFFKFVVY